MLHVQGGPSHLSPAAAGGGIGRGGTPVIGALQQGEAGTASPAPFTGYTSSPQMPPSRPAATGVHFWLAFMLRRLAYCYRVVSKVP